MTMAIKIKSIISFYNPQISKNVHKPAVQCALFQLAIEFYRSAGTQSVMKKADWVMLLLDLKNPKHWT